MRLGKFMKAENDFITELEKKAVEQHRLVQTQMIPDWAKGLGDWFAINPWRVIVPLASMGYAVCRIGYGVGFRELILGLFGGF